MVEGKSKQTAIDHRPEPMSSLVITQLSLEPKGPSVSKVLMLSLLFNISKAYVNDLTIFFV